MILGSFEKQSWLCKASFPHSLQKEKWLLRKILCRTSRKDHTLLFPSILSLHYSMVHKRKAFTWHQVLRRERQRKHLQWPCVFFSKDDPPFEQFLESRPALGWQSEEGLLSKHSLRSVESCLFVFTEDYRSTDVRAIRSESKDLETFHQ